MSRMFACLMLVVVCIAAMGDVVRAGPVRSPPPPKRSPPPPKRSPPRPPAFQPSNILQAAFLNLDQLSSVLYASIVADVVDYIKDSDAAYTAFLPNNEAFNRLARSLGYSLPEVLGAEGSLLRVMLSYMMVPGRRLTATQLQNGQGLKTLMAGANITVARRGSGRTAMTVLEGYYSSARIVKANIPAGKSIVHIIDTILQPVYLPNAAQCATPYPFMAALFACEPELVLTGSLISIIPSLSRRQYDGSTNGTVFAANNDVMLAIASYYEVDIDYFLSNPLATYALATYSMFTDINLTPNSLAVGQRQTLYPLAAYFVPSLTVTLFRNATGLFAEGVVNTIRLDTARFYQAGKANILLADMLLVPATSLQALADSPIILQPVAGLPNTPPARG